MAENTSGEEPTNPTAAEWSDKAVGLVDLVVDTIIERVIRPVILVGRTVVFGLIIAALVIVVAVVIGVAILRLLDVYAFAGHIWASYTVLGVITCAVGLVAWAKRGPSDADATD